MISMAMDWKTAAAYYSVRIRQALSVARHALHLCELPKAGASPELRRQLQEQIGPLERQLLRLEKGEFRIAVVGLEKSGKSTFVNAWLEHDLLPSDSARCTYVTTRVHSVLDDAQQRLEIDPLSADGFAARVEELQKAAQGKSEEANRAKADLHTIEANRESLRKVIDLGPRSIGFARLEEIADELRASVADQRHAYAIREVRLFTNRLAAADGIVFHDVPGLNSGLAKHMEESREMLADCDAVILVQRSSTPSIEGSEQKLIEFIREGDERVGVAAKLFVFFGRIDQEGSQQSLRDNLAIAARDWQERGRLSPDRIVPGSAAAYLVLKKLASETTLKNAGSPGKLLSNLRHVAVAPDQHDALLNATGIPEIKGRIHHYLNHERVDVLRARCDGGVDAILRLAQKLYADVSERYPEDPELARKLHDDERRIQFSQWWEPRWDFTRAELNRYYEREVIRRTHETSAPQPNALRQLRNRYESALIKGLDRLPALAADRRDTIFDAGPIFDSSRANLEWRRELHHQVSDLLEEVAHELALELEDEATALFDKMTDLLFGAARVRTELIRSSDHLRVTMENGLRALFLRFARPVAEALVRGPFNSETRQGIVAKLGPDIELIDNYYEGENPSYRSLKKYIQHGRNAANIEDPPVNGDAAGPHSKTAAKKGQEPAKTAASAAASATASAASAASSRLFSGGRRAATAAAGTETASAAMSASSSTSLTILDRRAEMVHEVQADLAALREYLIKAVFAAAGFAAFCEQELGRFRDRFLETESIWRGVAENEWLQGNPRILAAMPPELRDQGFDAEICDRLRQLGIAVREAWRAIGGEPASAS